MRIVCLSDTHDDFPGLAVPEGDLLLHGGDHSRRGEVGEVTASAEWLRSLPHRHKVVIAGNHDFCMESDPERTRGWFRGMTYLEDEGVEIEGLRIFGSPWSPAHGKWAFQRERGADIRAVWQRIPEDVQLLITHGPPYGIRDRTVQGVNVGCEELLARMRQLKPLLHLFGHIHEGYGVTEREGTFFVNACNCSLGYKYLQAPLVFDWNGRELRPVQVAPAVAEARAQPMWTRLVQEHGPPHEVRYWPHERQQAELKSGHVFWIEIVSDGYGSGEVTFRRAAPEDDLRDRGPDPQHRRFCMTFGVPFQEAWAEQLRDNPWERYSEIPDLPT